MRALFLFPLLAACVSEGVPTEADIGAARGQALFAENCVACHGSDATGGVGPDLTQLSARNGGVFPQVPVLATIDGLSRHGDAAAVMPEFGAGNLGDAVIVELDDGTATPVPADLLALSAYLRSVQR
ncbi:cytochrome c [Jannaschia sp. M317]|uniref:c-type cytochrome n=1 Tax=Jannaschia sp. M317 TaxID=2867011 RepID=UPI0021A976AB|nr:cytochrome c [Jannaschia sp. M317]UWQ19937.1 cytochrome c [Jannaschia sp. M317]